MYCCMHAIYICILTAELQRRIQVMEMKCYQKILPYISYMDLGPQHEEHAGASVEYHDLPTGKEMDGMGMSFGKDRLAKHCDGSKVCSWKTSSESGQNWSDRGLLKTDAETERYRVAECCGTQTDIYTYFVFNALCTDRDGGSWLRDH